MIQSHLGNIANALKNKFDSHELVVLNCEQNSGSFTYDGIEVGAERVAKEIEDRLNALADEGLTVTKLSMVGYSLGGLVARYAIGLLYSKQLFDTIEPVNFTTFATPHLGIRTPLKGYAGQIWNAIGPQVLSTSGRQMFAIDNFRDTGRPILSIMTDPDSIFIHALAAFKHRSLYTNIINDRSAVYYTTSISSQDPYIDLTNLDLHHVEGYEPVILDPKKPFSILPPPPVPPTLYTRIATTSQTIIDKSPRIAAFCLIFPLAFTVFILSSVVQEYRSQQRVALHKRDGESLGFAVYHAIPWMVRDVRANLEGTLGRVTSSQEQRAIMDEHDHPDDATDDLTPPELASRNQDSTSSSTHLLDTANDESFPPLPSQSTTTQPPQSPQPVSSSQHPIPSPSSLRASTDQDQDSPIPTLALTPAQFTMIDNLDAVGFTKYPVHIHKSSHSHAAIIRRSDRSWMAEGEIVIRHWLEENFVL